MIKRHRINIDGFKFLVRDVEKIGVILRDADKKYSVYYCNFNDNFLTNKGEIVQEPYKFSNLKHAYKVLLDFNDKIVRSFYLDGVTKKTHNNFLVGSYNHSLSIFEILDFKFKLCKFDKNVIIKYNKELTLSQFLNNGDYEFF